MTSSASMHDQPWWRRRGPSVWVFVVVLAAMVVASIVLWARVSDVLSDVGKDQQGEDPWTDQVGVELVGQFQVARIPDCASAPVVRIELWDEDSDPYWVAAGPPTPMGSFAIGMAPEGFTDEVPFRAPADDAVLRLVVVRSVKGVAGLTYRTEDLRSGYVATGEPIRRYRPDRFAAASLCAENEDDEDDEDDGDSEDESPDADGTDPDGTDPEGTDPDGTDPEGTDPSGP